MGRMLVCSLSGFVDDLGDGLGVAACRDEAVEPVEGSLVINHGLGESQGSM